MSIIKIKNRLIGDGRPTFIIAEAGSNHNGSLDCAKKLIDVAVEAKVDAVKFQLFKADRLYPKNCGIVNTPMGKVNLFSVLHKAEMPEVWLKTLKIYAERKGLIFLCTCFDEESADKLEDIGISAYKLGAPELNHIPLLKHVAKKYKPVILSTGLSTLSDIEEAVNTCYDAGNKRIALLHCVSAYPTPLKDCNLNVISLLKLAFGVPIGFSDHTLDAIAAPLVAVSTGATIIEKHFTLSRELKGPDHSFAIEPGELKELVRAIRKLESSKDRVKYVQALLGRKKVEIAAGSFRKRIAPSEYEIYPNDKRSILAARNIKKGSILNRHNAMVLRSERNLNTGIHPRFYGMVLGKIVTKDISYGEGITWKHLLSPGLRK